VSQFSKLILTTDFFPQMKSRFNCSRNAAPNYFLSLFYQRSRELSWKSYTGVINSVVLGFL